MTQPDLPRTYLITPPSFTLSKFLPLLDKALETTEIACLRLSMTSLDEDVVAKTADVLRETCHARDVPLVIDQHHQLVQRLGLDGCHLGDNAKLIREVRKELGSDAIIGANCAASKHAGLNAAEAGADYITFGPLVPSILGDGQAADLDLLTWWSEMIEVPVVLEGGLTSDTVSTFAPHTDFFAIGPEIWELDDPVQGLSELTARYS